ncbi:MAG: transglutaminase domain-containing protein [Clostridia bacterium]|nr:transglutaminase domain-containing protein [Clostridia bacterium]
MRKRVSAFFLCCILMATCLVSCARVDHSHVQFRNLTWAVSTPLPKAEDFVVDLPDGYSVRFAQKYTFSQIKEYTLELILSDERGRETTHTVKFNLIVDNEPPTLTGLRDLSVVLGRGVSYLSGVTATDNCDSKVNVSVDSTGVNLRAVGVYTVYYTATDAAGNSTRYPMHVTVYEQEVTKEMLWSELDPVIDRITSDGMSLTQKLEAVYNYVHDNVAYVSTSDKSDWVHAAYEGLTMHRGDCYTYFALSKAFFERLGIENLDVCREATAVTQANERHFWNMVNIGTAEHPRWYHFDACRMKDLAKPWGFLMTDAQLAWYTEEKVNESGVGNYFYAFDTDLYPATPTQKINTDY